MNLTRFISSKLSASTSKGFTSIIIKIAIASIALSLVIMIITTSMIRGFKNQITDKIFGFWGHIHITDTNINRTFETVPIDISRPYYQDLKNLENLDFQKPADILGVSIEDSYMLSRTTGGVSHVQSFTIVPGIINTKKEFEGVFVKGVGKDFDWERMSQYIVEGGQIENAETPSGSRGAVISRVIAQRMGVALGDKFNCDFIIDGKQIKRQFTISGIYNTGLSEYDKKFILVDQTKIQGVLGWGQNQVGGIELFVDNIDDISAISEYIYYDILPSNLYSQTIKEKFGDIFEWLELQNINETVILILMIVVCIINMITALLILILERSKMIGILKSLGMKNWGVRKIFIYFAGHIVLRGMIIGTVIGIVLCLLQQYFGLITLDEQNYYLAVAPIEINIWTILLLNIATAVITLLFLTIPTYIVTYITPVKALRFD